MRNRNRNRTRTRRRTTGRQISFAGTQTEIARLERIAREYEKRVLPGGDVHRTVAARAAMLVGLDKIESDYGLPPMAPVPAKSDKAPQSRTRIARNPPKSVAGAKQ